MADTSPLDVFRWIGQADFGDLAQIAGWDCRRACKAVAQALLRRVDRHTWRWPSVAALPGGVSLRGLGDLAEYSARHVRRVLRLLEEGGVVTTTRRAWACSEYELHPAALQARVSARPPAPAPPTLQEEQLERELRARAEVEARQAAAPATGPEWARQAAAREGRPVSAVVELVAGVGQILHVADDQLGTIARPLVRLWRALGHPAASGLVADVRVVMEGARLSPHQHFRALRGEGRNGKRWGDDRSQQLGYVLSPSHWPERVRLARAFAAERAASAAELAIDAEEVDDGAALDTFIQVHDLVGVFRRRGAAAARRALEDVIHLGPLGWSLERVWVMVELLAERAAGAGRLGY